MADDRERHQRGKVAGGISPGVPRGASQGPGDPGGSSQARHDSSDDVDEMFDRAFEATFRSATVGGQVASASGDRAPRPSATDIQVDVGEPVPEAQTLGGGGGQGVPAELARLAREVGVPAIDVDRVSVDLSLLGLVPREMALRSLVLPLCVREGRLFVAVAEPQQRRTLDELEFVSGLRLVVHVAAAPRLRAFIEACYRARAAGQRIFGLPGALPLGQIEAVTVRPTDQRWLADGEDLAAIPSGVRAIDLGPDGSVSVVSPSVEPEAGRPRRRVLVVDDEDDIRLLMVRILRDKGYEVLEATQGAEALRMVQARLPDLLVLDAMLPEIHGFDVCRRIKSSPRYRHIPVIIISAVYRGWRFAVDLKKSYGVDCFMEKPFRIGELVERVEQLLSGQPAVRPSSRELSARARAELLAGMRAAEAGNLETAIRHLKTGLEADPLSHELYYQLGRLYAKLGRIYEAIQALEAGLEIEPEHFATLRGLGQLYEHAGFPCKAAEMWERAAGVSTDEAVRASIKEHLVKLL